MQILFLSHYFPPELNAPASRTFEHAKRWHREGHEITIITCAPNHPTGVLQPGYKNKLFQIEHIEGIRVLRIWTYLAPNKGKVKRVLNYISFMISAFTASFFAGKSDILLATSPQFFCGLCGALVSLFRKNPFILEIRDIWPESIVTVGAMKKGIAIRTIEVLERWMYRRATHIVTVGNGYKKVLIGRGVSSKKITVIENGIDTEVFKDSSNAAFPLDWSLTGKFVCSYVGTVGMAHGLDILIRAARILKANGDESICFLVVGDGAEREWLEEQSKDLLQLKFVGSLAKAQIPGIISSSNCCLVHLRKTALFETVLPSKIFEAMGMKRPVILGVKGEAAQVISSANAGICIEPENEHELLSAVAKLKEDPALCQEIGERAYSYVLKNYNRDKNAKRYLELLSSLAGVLQK